jgi:uncharacterized protein
MYGFETARAAAWRAPAVVRSFMTGCTAVCLSSLAISQAAGRAPQAAQSPQELAQLLPSFVTSCSRSAPAADYERHSVYVPAADGVKLAMDIFVPKGAAPGARFPVLYSATRYWRAAQDGVLNPVQQEWLARGFVVANADVRGTGASFGQWYIPYLVTYADDPIESYHRMSMVDASAYTFREPLEKSRVPIFGWGSWLDSGIAQGLLNRFMTFSNPQLTIIGPWTHGAREDVNVFAPTEELEPSRTEQDRMVACYLGHYVKAPQAGERAGSAQAGRAQHTLVYFTMGENRWKSTDTWPIPGTRLQRYYLDGGHSLATGRPADGAEDSYKVDFDASAGPANRWATQAGGPRINYADRAAAHQRLLTYTSAPLAGDIEMTGQPVITLVVRSNHTDGNFFVYLEDVAPDGRVTYLTEGQLRALHRKLSSAPAPYKTTYPYRSFLKADAGPLVPGELATLTFQLQATSVLLSRGHRIRVAIAGADKGNFIRRPSPEEGEVTIQVARGGAHVSFIELPVVPRRS